MDVMLVWQAFITLTGMTKEEARTWLPLCHWSTACLFGRVRPGVDLAANQTALCYAAGAMAYYKYVLRTASLETTATFAAGDVKIAENATARIEAARALCEEAVQSVKHLCGDDMWLMGVGWE